MADVCTLLFELSHQDRLRILRTLDEQPMIVTRLSEELDLKVQETSRHLSRLVRMGLIVKDLDGLHHLSKYARLVLDQLPALEFTYQHRGYFATHTLDGLPHQYVCRLGELGSSTRIDDVMIGFYNVDRLLQEAEKYVWSITDQYLVSQARYFKEALERGVCMKNIDAPYSIVIPAREHPEEWSRPSYLKAITQARQEGQLQERFMERIGVYLYMSEREVAALAFPLEDGGFDYVGFTSTNDRFHGWCSDLFSHCWEGADPRSEVLDNHQKWLLKRPGAIKALRRIEEGGEPEGEHIAELEERGLVRKNKLTYLGRVLYLRLVNP